jgi:anaerobic selenocysteine-containing dehydrogenase
VLIVTDILPNKTTQHATVLLPASGWAEKRGSMINFQRPPAAPEPRDRCPGDATTIGRSSAI